MSEITCFKAYDIRGQLGTQLNEEIAYRIARAFAQWLKPDRIVLGGDVRVTSAALKAALANGLRDEGVNVLDLGLAGTEEVYFATFHLGVEGGIEVTASHNPIDYNGLKLVREGSRPISADTGLVQIRELAEANVYELVDGRDPTVPEDERGTYELVDTREAYIQHLLGYIEPGNFTPLKLVVNAGNGTAGPAIDALEAAFKRLAMPVELVKICHEPDGSFPNGIPNPILTENRGLTRDAVLEHKADMGIAWDGDFDRCFLFDEQGRFIEGYYIVGLLAEAFLQKEPGARIIHDPRLVWNTVEQVEAGGGVAVQTKAGHAFIKERMREEDAVYGGEMSAHHYFRDFAYCDSGMIPWLLVAELLCVKGKPMSELVDERIAAFPSSGEINLTVSDAPAVLKAIEAKYAPDALEVDHTDGVSICFADWRFNLRASNTEPVIRLNVESRGDQALMERETARLVEVIGGL
ncbi:phosphomannomutase/phosphoglucomutase [Halopseudomonas pelagia]|uniref:phosphomannomutase/phosphoglucomutase n=1 Tax=Halopseudomonas pelagia TaxID=553151 RepID=UPI0003A89D12|nr:phosphomannomutase/phosphoglucomutase [Halopseudomonas pelagia]|tara:strand:+ start:42617 stop:44011 length:1395 start_codon:yes stop_codon:yes gene_type:complete